MLFFTSRGRVFQLRVHGVPEMDRAVEGQAVNNLVETASGERVTAVFVRPETDDDEAGKDGVPL